MLLKIENIPARGICNFRVDNPLFGTDSCLAAAADATGLADGLLKNIMQISGVERCLITSDTVSIKYKTDNFDDVRTLVMAEIDDFATDMHIFPQQNKLNLQDTAEALADAFIRPTLNRDNGDIEIYAVANSLELKFTGHCAGCPYAQNTLQNVILKIFNKYLPEIKNIVLKESS